MLPPHLEERRRAGTAELGRIEVGVHLANSAGLAQAGTQRRHKDRIRHRIVQRTALHVQRREAAQGDQKEEGRSGAVETPRRLLPYARALFGGRPHLHPHLVDDGEAAPGKAFAPVPHAADRYLVEPSRRHHHGQPGLRGRQQPIVAGRAITAEHLLGQPAWYQVHDAHQHPGADHLVHGSVASALGVVRHRLEAGAGKKLQAPLHAALGQTERGDAHQPPRHPVLGVQPFRRGHADHAAHSSNGVGELTVQQRVLPHDVHHRVEHRDVRRPYPALQVDAERTHRRGHDFGEAEGQLLHHRRRHERGRGSARSEHTVDPSLRA